MNDFDDPGFDFSYGTITGASSVHDHDDIPINLSCTVQSGNISTLTG